MGVIDDLLAKDPEQRDVEFCTDHQIREALSRTQYRLAELRRRLDGISGTNREVIRELRKEIDDLVAREEDLISQAREKLVRLTFKALPGDQFDELVGQHRPTETQRTEARKAKRAEPTFNTDTFPPVLIAAACIRVETPSGSADGLSPEDAERLWRSDSYNDTERAEIFNTAHAAQVSRMRIDLPKDG